MEGRWSLDEDEDEETLPLLDGAARCSKAQLAKLDDGVLEG